MNAFRMMIDKLKQISTEPIGTNVSHCGPIYTLGTADVAADLIVECLKLEILGKDGKSINLDKLQEYINTTYDSYPIIEDEISENPELRSKYGDLIQLYSIKDTLLDEDFEVKDDILNHPTYDETKLYYTYDADDNIDKLLTAEEVVESYLYLDNIKKSLYYLSHNFKYDFNYIYTFCEIVDDLGHPSRLFDIYETLLLISFNSVMKDDLVSYYETLHEDLDFIIDNVTKRLEDGDGYWALKGILDLTEKIKTKYNMSCEEMVVYCSLQRLNIN